MNKALYFLKKYGSDILSIVAGIGVVATGVTAYKCGDDKDKKKSVPICIGLGTIGCIAGARILDNQNKKELIAAGSAIALAYEQYRNNVNESLSEEEKEKINKNYISSQEGNIEDTGFGNDVFVEAFSGRTFISSKEKVREAIDKINDDFLTTNFASLSSFYRYNGLDSTPLGDNCGWCLENMAHYHFYGEMDDIEWDIVPESVGIDFEYYPGVGYVINYEHNPLIR